MMSCQEATRLLSEAKERPLGTKEKLALKVHLTMCGGCRNFDKQINFIRNATRAFAKGEDERINKDTD